MMMRILQLLLIAGTFFGRTTYADVPTDQTSTWLDARFSGEEIEVLEYEHEVLEFTGHDLHMFKVFNLDTEVPDGVVFDERGNALPDRGASLLAVEVERRYDLVGALDDELWEMALAADDVTRIPVSIWLRTYEPVQDRLRMEADPLFRQAIERQNEDSRDQARISLLTDWSNVASSGIVFEATAPVAYAELTRDELFTFADHPAIAEIAWDAPSVPQWTTYVGSVYGTLYGATGAGVKVCVIEPDSLPTPNNLTVQDTYCGASPSNTHGQWVMGLIRSGTPPYGVAPDSLDYLATWADCDANFAPAISWCATKAARVWNFSHTCDTHDNRLFDYYAKQVYPYPLPSVASGNLGTGTSGTCPASCTNSRSTVTCAPFNGVVVGGSNDCGTTVRSDDHIWCGARDENVNGRELPNLVAPAYSLTSEGMTKSGTSGAAPIVAGVAAQLIETDSDVAGAPEALRSILMTGASRDVDNGRFNIGPTIDDRDGAGLLDANRSNIITSNRVLPNTTQQWYGWDWSQMSSSSTPAGSFSTSVYSAYHVVASGRLRVVLSWDSHATCTNPSLDTGSCASDALDADLDLYVYRHSDNQRMGYSTSSADSYEFVEFETTAGETYDIKIYAWSWTSSYTYYGIAWYQGSYSL